MAPAEHPALLHHFESLEQQRDAALLGMWAFLATEVLFFGGLFTAYTVYRVKYGSAFEAGSHHLDVLLGSFNTVVLIGSSLTMALAVFGAERGDRKKVTGFMALTILLGLVFLSVKALEWSHDYEEKLVPRLAFDPDRWVQENVSPGQGELFFILYFSMTGLHAVHMIAGMAVMAFFLRPAWLGAYSHEYYTPIEILGLYWHFVELIWIFLFPLFYLAGTR